MFLRILKKDIKRKKTMNIIMLVFIILASMFVASGLNNVITIANGTNYFFLQPLPCIAPRSAHRGATWRYLP